MLHNKRLSSVLCTGLLAVTSILAATSASAEYPGEIWTIESVELRGIEAVNAGAEQLSLGSLRRGLQHASEVYFFGDRGARLRAEVLAGSVPAVRLLLIERTGGTVVARSPRIELPDDGASVEAMALAWMEGLTCASAGCAALPEVEQPVRVAKARLDLNVKEEMAPASETAFHVFAGFSTVPLPVRRPEPGLGMGRKARGKLPDGALAAKEVLASTQVLQIAWAIPREVGALTYGESDRVVTGSVNEALNAGPAAPVRPEPVSGVSRADPLVSRLFSSVFEFFGFGDRQDHSVSAGASSLTPEETARPTETAVDLAPALESVAEKESQIEPATSPWTRASAALTLINPVERTGPAQRSETSPEEVRLALASPQHRVTDTASTAVPTESIATDPIRPARRARAEQRTVTPPRSVTTLKVKLHPELLGRYGSARLQSAALARLQRSALASAPTERSSDVTRSGRLTETLGGRGLELDVATYSRFQQFYWSGYGEEGFWVSMPNLVGAEYVLVSGPTGSVIAAVRQRDGIAKASPGVAEALGLQSRQWARLRVVALRKPGDLRAELSVPTRKGRNLIH